MKSFKGALAKGWSYGLQPSKLSRAIDEAGISIPISLYQHYKPPIVGVPAFSARFYPKGWQHFYETDCVWVSSYAVRADSRQTAAAFAEGLFVPRLIEWIVSLERLERNATARREAQTFYFDGGPKALAR